MFYAKKNHYTLLGVLLTLALDVLLPHHIWASHTANALCEAHLNAKGKKESILFANHITLSADLTTAVYALHRSVMQNFDCTKEEFLNGGYWQAKNKSLRTIYNASAQEFYFEAIDEDITWSNSEIVHHGRIKQSSATESVLYARKSVLHNIGTHINISDYYKRHSVRPEFIGRLINTFNTNFEPLIFNAENAEQLAELILTNPNILPIVYVTAQEREGTPLFDVNALAKSLGGVAIVVSESTSLKNALLKFLPQDSIAWDGAIRIYPPGGDGTIPQTSQLTLNKMKLSRMSIIDATRNLIQLSVPYVGLSATIYDYEASQDAQSPVALLEAERKKTEALRLELEELRAQLSAHIKEKDELLSEHTTLRQDHDAATGQVDSLTVAIEHLNRERINAQSDLARISSVPPPPHITVEEAPDGSFIPIATVFHSLEHLPTSIFEVTTTASKLLSGRLLFTERSFRSAKHTTYQDPAKVWRTLHAIANHLHDIYFSNTHSVDVESEFYKRSGIELAVTESSATKNNARLMQLREDTYSGEPINASAHVKVNGKKHASHLRIHYAVDRQRRRIIISYVGDHLETSGTSRM